MKSLFFFNHQDMIFLLFLEMPPLISGMCYMLTPCSWLVDGCIRQVLLQITILRLCFLYFWNCLFYQGTERLRESKTAWKLATALPSSIKISTSSSTLGRLNFPESPLSCLSKVLENTICTTGEVRFSLLSFLSSSSLLDKCLDWCVFCVDYLSLWWTIGVPICCRKYWRPCLSCCFPSLIYVSGTHTFQHIVCYLQETSESSVLCSLLMRKMWAGSCWS